jgi:hypothetical protein
MEAATKIMWFVFCAVVLISLVAGAIAVMEIVGGG